MKAVRSVALLVLVLSRLGCSDAPERMVRDASDVAEPTHDTSAPTDAETDVAIEVHDDSDAPADVDEVAEAEVDEPADVIEVGPDANDTAIEDTVTLTDATEDVLSPRFIRGELRLERRRPNPTRSALQAPEEVPLAGRDVIVSRRDETLGVARTDADGRFVLALDGGTPLPAGASIELLVVAASPLMANAAPAITILDGANVTFPSATNVPIVASRVWAWSFEGTLAAGDDTDLGALVIDIPHGSGAMQLLLDLEHAWTRATTFFGTTDVPTLGVLWSPAVTPPCLSCYFPAPWGPLTLRTNGLLTATFDRAMFLSGADAAPHHWTPSLSGHELGHWVMDVFSRLPPIGGAHAWSSLVAPSLAWSEGFATFYAQWSLSDGEVDARFFTEQQNIQYWIDLERIGTGVTTDQSSLGFTFPLPDTSGPLTQPINEGIVAATLWDLYDDMSEADHDTVALGDTTLATIDTQRMHDAALDRGAPDPDLVDYLDAHVCAGRALDALFGFPWTGPATCP